jgi:hypothetical protein
MSVRTFSERIDYGGKMHSECEQHHPIGWGSGRNKNVKKREPTSVSIVFLCFLSAMRDLRWGDLSYAPMAITSLSPGLMD